MELIRILHISVFGIPCGRSRNCGPGSKCELIKNQPTCICANGLIPQNPEMICTASCQRDSDCASAKSCDYPNCVNTCDKFNPCGINANCRISRHVTICECKFGFTGDPVKGCTAIPGDPPVKPNGKTPSSPCEVLSCGSRARCILVNGQPRCVCESGFSGHPPECQSRPRAGPCDSDTACPSDRACVQGTCVNPCSAENACGVDADCTVKNQAVLCSCPNGYEGNALERCVVSNGSLSGAPPVPFSPRCPFNLCSENTSRQATSSKKRVPTLSNSNIHDELVLYSSRGN